MTTRPTCPRCAGVLGKHVLCDVCWSEVPQSNRRAVLAAWKAATKRPTSTVLAREYDLVIADAIGAIR